MFRLLIEKKETKVNNIALLRNSEVILKDDEFIIKNDNQINIKKAANKYFHKLFKIDDTSFLFNYDESDIIIFSVNKEFRLSEKKLDSLGSVVSINNSGSLFYYSKWISHYPVKIESGIFDIKNNVKIWSKEENTNGEFVNNYLVSTPFPSKIRLLNAYTGNLIFEYEIQEEYWIDLYKQKKRVQIKEVIWVTKENIWIGLTNGKILAIDIKKGSKKHLIFNKDFENNYESNLTNAFPDTGIIKFDDFNQNLIGLRNNQYYEIDLQTYLVRYFDLSDIFKKAKIRASVGINGKGDFVFDEKFIYFIDKMNNKIGVLDRQKKEVEWQFSFNSSSDKRVFPMKLLKQENKLYVIDNNRSLHCFQEI
jgi:hypothetical protein